MPDSSLSRWRRLGFPTLLLLLSIVTTMAIGARFMQNFHDGLPLVAHDSDLWPWPWLLEQPSRLLLGWPFSLAILTILLTHEFGHYIACRMHRVRCTLPWVLPAPTLSGTFGAVIRLRSRIPDRRVLMDIGVWGPIAGYVASLIAAIIGLRLSAAATVLHRSGIAPEIISFRNPATLTLLESAMARLTPSPGSALAAHADPGLLHPVLLAAWIGFFVTSLNLIPCGQLDGGHILYAISPRLHRIVSLILPVLLFAAAWYWWIGWSVWGIVLLIPVMRHPRVVDNMPLGRGRTALGVLALALFLLTLTAAPFSQSSLASLLH